MNEVQEMRHLLEAGRTTFGPNYNPDMRYTDTNAPNPGDEVKTSDGGRGIVVDNRQNNEGYYVFFSIDMLEPAELDGHVRDYHISAIKRLD